MPHQLEQNDHTLTLQDPLLEHTSGPATCKNLHPDSTSLVYHFGMSRGIHSDVASQSQ
jgi:hypothetical protein